MISASSALAAKPSLSSESATSSKSLKKPRGVIGKVFGERTMKGEATVASSKRDGNDKPSVLISASEAKAILSSSDAVVLLDASWYMPAVHRDPKKEFSLSRIPNSKFFDVDAVKDVNSSLSHMLPESFAFSAACDALGIENDAKIIVYDRAERGMFSAARCWWMFEVFSHSGDVFVVDGGFEAWKREGYEIDKEEKLESIEATGEAVELAYREGGREKRYDYTAQLDQSRVIGMEDVLLQVVEKEERVCVDARPEGRFLGTVPEPRAGLAKGSIPNSKNVPFPEVMDTETGAFKDIEALSKVFENAGIDVANTEKTIVATCGTGVTACILTLALKLLGRDDVAVYDGSWCEWGSKKDVPVAN